jgi:serpin B
MTARGARLAALALVAVLALVGAAAARAAPAQAPAAAEDSFALALLRQMPAGPNLVYSPYSVDVALSMAAAGARGTTAEQIDRLLGAPSSSVATTNAAALLRAVAAAAPGVASGAPTLEVANALWIQTDLPVNPAFAATLSSSFNAPPQSTDFTSAPEAARQAINAWVSQHTHRLISGLLPAGSISPATVFVLANAIYLKANWASPFAARLTHAAPFTTSTGRRVSVPFMSANRVVFPYASGSSFQAVELPYRSSSLSLLAILPVGRSLGQLDATLNATALASLTVSLQQRQVDLRMPKLHLHTQTALNDPLRALGMTAAFGPSADFGGIATGRALAISLVEHAADLRVDEQGTVAAAATGIVGPTAIALPQGPVVSVNLDRPYLLLLRDDTSGAILFVARVGDPSTT